jgi:hypothetical protein
MDPWAMPSCIGGASGRVTHSPLFVIAIDMLVAMFRDAKQASILSSLTTAGLKHQVSLYTDNVVVFARPDITELGAVSGILECFGEASGLKVNFSKSEATPIQCSDSMIATVRDSFPCRIVSLPCSYLGLPLSI